MPLALVIGGYQEDEMTLLIGAASALAALASTSARGCANVIVALWIAAICAASIASI